jgi:hypothetical protein
MERFARHVVERHARSHRLAKAFGSAVGVYVSALVGVQVTALSGAEAWGVVLMHAALVIVLVAGAYVTLPLVDDGATELTDRRRDLLLRAHGEAVTAVTRAQAALVAGCREWPMPVPHVPHDAMAAIDAEISALYRTLDGSQDASPIPGTRIDFQVTFMTRSYRDGKITIAAWANRFSHRPFSLRLRAENPDVYEQTATAELYRSLRPVPWLVESTTLAGFDYRPLYPEQKAWIQSTVIYPVLDPAANLLGTLVASCNSEGYFRQRDYGFWCELFEPFAFRIGLEKQRLDETVLLDRDVGTPAVVALPPPF